MRLRLVSAFHWSIQYEIYGYPLPNVTWFKDGSPLVHNDVIYDRVTSRSDALIKGGLTFKMSTHFDNGNYTLVARNEYGSTSQTVSAVFLQSPGMQYRAVELGFKNRGVFQPCIPSRTKNETQESQLPQRRRAMQMMSFKVTQGHPLLCQSTRHM